MPISYTIDAEQRRISTKVTGPVTVDEIVGHFEAVRQESILEFAEFIDLEAVTPPFLSTSEIWRVATWILSQPRGQFGLRAVVTQDELIYGMARIFTAVVSGFFPIEVFHDANAAEEWLAAKR